MKIIATAVIMSILFIACNKNNDSTRSMEGRFAGTFTRTGMDTVAVEINFLGNTFDGFSTQAKYPAICNGSFALNKNKITFHDSCIWTADFDWTLILDGEYSINFEDERTVRIWRNNGATTDEYLLVRLIR